jgi:hypothetical protein
MLPTRRAFQLLVVAMLGNCSALASNEPTPEEFDRAIKACAREQRIELSAELLGSVTRLYSGQNSRLVFRSPAQFVLLMPEDARVDAYRLHADCITKVVPDLTAAPIPVAPATIYRVCQGEYERACQPHDVYIYCYSNVQEWAKARCTKFTIRRLNTYGGNKCGYSLDEVTCFGPK